MYQFCNYNWETKEYTLAYGFYVIFKNERGNVNEVDFNNLNKGDRIMVPAIDMICEEYIVTELSHLSLNLPEGVKCIKFKKLEK